MTACRCGLEPQCQHDDKAEIGVGEPFLHPRYIGEVVRFCKEELHIESCSVVNNGSKVTEKWLDTYSQYLDVMDISCDSFDTETNIKQGRAENGIATTHIDNVFKVTQCAKERGIEIKINTVVTINNWEEDMNDQIEQLAPFHWKALVNLMLPVSKCFYWTRKTQGGDRLAS